MTQDTSTELPTTGLVELDQTVILVDHHAEQARRSATVRTRVQLRQRVLRRHRQIRFSAAWGLR